MSSQDSRSKAKPKKSGGQVYFIGKQKYIISRKIWKQIRYYQKQTEILIPKASFARVVREILQDLRSRQEYFKFQMTALQALQEASEMYLTELFSDSQLLSNHAKRATIKDTDMQLVRFLRSKFDPYMAL